MPISWNEIRDRAVAFSKEWKGETSEDAEAKSFWDGFFNVFGVTRRRVATFETPVKKSDGKGGFIDLLWKGVVLVEHKSAGKDLNSAFHQATDYFHGLKERDLPRYVVVSDFARVRLYDLDEGKEHEFELKDLHRNARLFGFIAGYETRFFGEQDPVNIAAAERLGKLHDLLKAVGYEGHPLEVFLVRLLFCMFAEDNTIFERQQFRELIELRSAEDGSDLAPLLANLFQVLNTPPEKRLRNLDEQLAAFAYINGKLFSESLPLAAFDKKMRETLLECVALNWSRISPAIFGALFQSIMDKKARRNLGAHYTSEVNILKALQPLFLDALRAEFERVKRDKRRLLAFREKLGKIRILDPACGCGNFLVIAYRELRLIELDVLRELFKAGQMALDVSSIMFVDVDQFYGIEIEEFPAQIAQVALWMTDHQMNLKVSEEFGQYFARLPLKKAPNIVHGNALTIDWRSLVAPADLSYIVGNPPFIGHHLRDEAQAEDMGRVWGQDGRFGRLDYVACWHKRAAEFMAENKSMRTALVSTNSITQGEQAGILWPHLERLGVRINFAHRTFQWSNEARGKAAVHCVIIGFAVEDEPQKWLFEYDSPKSEPHVFQVTQLNGYLVEAANTYIDSRTEPQPGFPSMKKGSQPTDWGHLFLNSEERAELLSKEPEAKKFVRPFLGADEFLSSIPRWCLWLVGVEPSALRAMPHVMARVQAVQAARKTSQTESVRNYNQPSLFTQLRQPQSNYLLVPRHSSENRTYIPMGFFTPMTICGDANLMVPDATLFHFGVMSSRMHMAWVRTVCGRIKSDFRYSPAVYDSYPWPETTDKQRAAIETAAQGVLDARAQFKDSSLADLYDPAAMPSALTKAHLGLDRAVDAAYGKTALKTEAERVAYLFDLYRKITAPLDVAAEKKTRKAPKKATA